MIPVEQLNLLSRSILAEQQHKVLKKIEWSEISPEGEFCPECDAQKGVDPHYPECSLGKVIAAGKKVGLK